jgi:OmpA-OmpF porin, OOP family
MKFFIFTTFIWMQIGLFAQVAAPNLIENPSFEASDLKGVTLYLNSYSTKSPHEFEKRCPAWSAPWVSKPVLIDSIARHTLNGKTVDRALVVREGRRCIALTIHGCWGFEEKTISCRDYISQKLKTPLKKGNIYKIEVDAARHPWLAINKLGFFFSEKPAQPDKGNDWKGNPIRPQVVFDSILCKTTMTWYRLSATFQLNTDASYLYFGNFAALNEYQKIYNHWNPNEANFYNFGMYYFDNFNLTEVQDNHNSLAVNDLPKYSITCLSEPAPPNADITHAKSNTKVTQPPVSIGTKQKIVLNNVLFETNSDRLKTVHLPELDEFCQKLLKNPQLTLLITGHTDNVGNLVQNQQLSEKRANTIAQYLQGKGIDAKRIQKRGLGATQPIADNQTVEGREKNRRVEIEIN